MLPQPAENHGASTDAVGVRDGCDRGVVEVRAAQRRVGCDDDAVLGAVFAQSRLRELRVLPATAQLQCGRLAALVCGDGVCGVGRDLRTSSTWLTIGITSATPTSSSKCRTA